MDKNSEMEGVRSKLWWFCADLVNRSFLDSFISSSMVLLCNTNVHFLEEV
jgi:hypothetical protein